jgi:hypothetical protein
LPKETREHIAIIGGTFLLSRLLYHLAGIRFDGSTLGGFYQFIDPELLRTDLLRSVFYLHGQPPLFNLLVGSILKLFPGSEAEAFALLWGMLGLIFALSIFRLMVRLGVSKNLGIILTLLFMIGPQCILYENWLFYTYPIAVLISLSALFLHRYLSGRNWWDASIFFLLLASIALTRSLFHILWFVVIAVALMLYRKEDRRVIARTALLPFLLILSLYIKNAVMVGSFSSSTWLGMNLARATTFLLPEEVRSREVEQGKLSPLAMVGPFSGLSAYRTFPHPIRKTGIAVLDQEMKSTGAINVNNLEYVDISRAYLADALYVMIHYPGTYLKGTAHAYYTYFLPASNYYYLDANRKHIRGFERIYNLIFCGQLMPYDAGTKDETSEGYVGERMLTRGWLLVIGLPLLCIYGFLLLRSLPAGWAISSPFALTLLFMLLNILYVTIIGNAVEIGENQRFRFTIESFLVVMVGLLVTFGWRNLGQKFHACSVSSEQERG